jgi:hypothetical protein
MSFLLSPMSSLQQNWEQEVGTGAAWKRGLEWVDGGEGEGGPKKLYI